jgi:hypothetical protein
MSGGAPLPRDRVRIFNRNGFPMGEFRASVERSWALGDEGRAQFEYPTRKTAVVNEYFLQYGNWLLVENDYLPTWIGVLDTPRKWSARSVTVSAYAPDHIFTQRCGPLERKLTGSAGAVFEKIIALVNEPQTTILRAGYIWRGGAQREETINPTLLSEDLKRLWERSGEDYAWRAGVDSQLVVYGDWVKRLGVDTGIILQEGNGGGNIEAVHEILQEDGTIVNELFAYGDGLTWVSRPNVIVRDYASISRYGLRQGSEEYIGVTNLTTLKDNADIYLRKFANPARTYHLNALHKGGLFKSLALGNRYKLRLQNAGFNGGKLGLEKTVRITAMSYNPQVKGKIELTVDEELNDV